ncbi:MAG: hypothetical protein BJ554DRAFT_3722 [Olpidium bornovanus]|uniref:Uncharacterized protein n=1 Tax=Olpidium bornovanus TaxID=278681 RepID=A0A8H8DFM0_9FUNG|nr:MAG: hypothetical protein BJ554DRAFT_3722 [Olpidium bornovanus]
MADQQGVPTFKLVLGRVTSTAAKFKGRVFRGRLPITQGYPASRWLVTCVAGAGNLPRLTFFHFCVCVCHDLMTAIKVGDGGTGKTT